MEKSNINKFLTGISIGVVVALMPSSIFHQLFLALGLTSIANILSVTTSFMCFSIGVGVAYQFKLDFIAGISLAFVSMIASQAIQFETDAVYLKGTGDIINAMFIMVLGLLIIRFFPKRLYFYRLILLPALIILIAGSVSLISYDFTSLLSLTLGKWIMQIMHLQPLIMSCLIAVCFGVIIVSPISSVAIALIVGLTGTSAAAASVGISTIAMYLAIASFKENGIGSSIAIFIGSPKLMMSNFLSKPKILFPGMLASIIVGSLAYFWGFQGTSMSAGFGSSGLVGLIANLDVKGYTLNNFVLTILGFIIIPFIFSMILYLVFMKLRFINSKDFRIDIE